MRRLLIGSDHGGFELKAEFIKRLSEIGREAVDCGIYSPERVDYPDVAEELCTKLLSDNDAEFGILICGTGIGMSIAANKIKGIRAALCTDCYSARMAKEHNNANVITLGARTLGVELAWEIIKSYMSASFLGGQHAVRVAKLDKMIH